MSFWALNALYEFYRAVQTTGKGRPLIIPGLALALLLIIQPLFDRPDLERLVLVLAVTVPMVWIMLRHDKTTAFASWT